MNDQANTIHESAGLRPFFCAMIAIIPAYAATRSMLNQETLAVVAAAFAALLGYFGCRLVQLRGKFTLAMVVVAFPLLVALFFASLQTLSPFTEREKSVEILRDSHLSFHIRTTNELGEWRQSHSGDMLPIWLADLIGPDCLSELTMLNGELENYEAIRLELIDCSTLQQIHIVRSEGELPAVSAKLVDWLNQVDARTIHFDLMQYTDADGEMLARLKNEYSISIEILNQQTGDLSLLANAKRLTLRSRILQPRHLNQLVRLSDTALKLEGVDWTQDSIAALYGQPTRPRLISISLGTVDQGALRWCAEQPAEFFVFRDVKLAGMNRSDGEIIIRTNDAGVFPRIKHLTIPGAKITISDVSQLIDQFPCQTLSYGRDISESDLELLWESKALKEIHVRDSKVKQRKTYKRISEPAASTN